MTVTCPNCGARYRLPAAAAGRAARMRCAACDYRWTLQPETAAATPETEAEPAAAMSATGPATGTLHVDAPPEMPPEIPPDRRAAELPRESENRWVFSDRAEDRTPYQPDEDEEEQPRSRLLATLVAIIVGLALSLAAAGLWLGDVRSADVTRLPVIGPQLATMMPVPSRLRLDVRGMVTQLDSGGLVLQVNGSITNAGRTAQTLPRLLAVLSGPRGVALRWTVAPPVAILPAGRSVRFESVATNFPADARSLSITAAR